LAELDCPPFSEQERKDCGKKGTEKKAMKSNERECAKIEGKYQVLRRIWSDFFLLSALLWSDFSNF